MDWTLVVGILAGFTAGTTFTAFAIVSLIRSLLLGEGE